MSEFGIPVVFDVEASDELEAARFVYEALVESRKAIFVRDPNHPYPTHETYVDDWLMPNHPSVDQSDRQAVMVYIKTNHPKTQEEADAVVKAFYEWYNRTSGWSNG
jgi:hypothetical protein